MALFALVLVVGVYIRWPKPAAISGDYYLTGSIQLQDSVSDTSMNYPLFETLFTISSPAFRFSDNDTVHVNPVIGRLFFNDTLFHYDIKLHTIRFSNADTSFSIPYSGKGSRFSLTLNHPLIKFIDLNSEHTHAFGVHKVGLSVN